MQFDSIVDVGRISPSIDSNYFPDTQSNWCWSSSHTVGPSDSALVYFYYRSRNGSYRNSYNAVWLVAGAAITIAADQQIHDYVPNQTQDSRYTLHEDGTVTDTWNGLMWQRCSLGQTWNGSTCTGNPSRYTWQGALQQGEGNSFAGYSDWRLPNRKELRSIVAYYRYDPAINTTVFPNTPYTYWSSSPSAGNSGNAWSIVDFARGSDGSLRYRSNDYSGNGYAGRLVRGGQ